MNDITSPPALAGFHALIALPVLWGDQDAIGHVNNVVHLRWFESSRVAYMERCGLQMIRPGAGGHGPILASLTCHYRRQLNFPDTVLVGARVSRIGRSSVTIEHAVYSRQLDALAADGHSIVVAFDYTTGQSIPVSPEVRAAIEALEGKTF